MKKINSFPLWLVYGVPIALWIYAYVEHGYCLWKQITINSEYGLIENVTALALLVSIMFFLMCLKYAEASWEKAWILILAVGSFYFLGEELSWGYHFIGYHVDDQLRAVNDHGETNLHNLKGAWAVIFSTIPRQLLSIGVVVGGLLGYWADRRDNWLKNRALRRMIPQGNTLFMAIAASLISVPQKIMEQVLREVPKIFELTEPRELKECFLALFIALYAYSIWKRFSETKEM